MNVEVGGSEVEGSVTSKVSDMRSAISDIEDGMVVAFGGTYLTDEPVAAAAEVIRQGKRDLDLVLTEGACLVGDLLIGAGCVSRITTSTLGFMRLEAIGPRFRQAAESGSVRIREMEQNQIHAALRAASQGIPFMPTLAGLGCDYHKVNPDIQLMEDPFGHGSVVVVRAIEPDVMVVRTAIADHFGNGQHGASLHYDVLGCRAAKSVIVVAERIASAEAIARRPHATSVSGYNVASVVEQPYGGYPSEGEALYGYDIDACKEYILAASDDRAFSRYVEDRIMGVDTWDEFLERFVGQSRLAELNSIV